jgi:imidazole glycerol-phosphate synthase subunit HisF
MLNPRITPCLLIQNKGLVKTIKFGNPKYVGDPINAVKIFNEKAVDELIILDIDASVQNREPDYKMIENIANECRMPLCYGGGIKSTLQAQKILSLGVEKIAISSAFFDNPNLINEIADRLGRQSVVVVFDVKKKLFSGYEVYKYNAKTKVKQDYLELVEAAQKIGAGEIVINSIDNDGVMKGYDLDLITRIKNKLNIPLTVLGGVGSLDDIATAIKRFGIIGCAAGSLFVFKGKYKAVLINYPSQEKKNSIIKKQLL